MINLQSIKRPTLLLDEEKCRNNIKMMSARAASAGVKFRPHFKTHQSISIGEWFREYGVNSITVSSVTMAGHFASHGWKDITVAFPASRREVDEMKAISSKTRLNILISTSGQLAEIGQHIRFEAGCFIKIDTGYNRCGTEWNDRDSLMQMTAEIGNAYSLSFSGFLTHSGHTYKAGSPEEIKQIYDDTIKKMNSLHPFTSSGKAFISIGDTPSCSLVEDLSGADEIRPGNFVFYDLKQSFLGSCSREQIAVAVACPVVDKNIKRSEIIIYGGGVHLSKESLRLRDGRTIFGLAVRLNENGWIFPENDEFVKAISQEHGIISCSPDFFNSLRIGDLVGILPVHSCMTADLLREYHTTAGRIIADFSPK